MGSHAGQQEDRSGALAWKRLQYAHETTAVARIAGEKDDSRARAAA
jgi:hypothetical protein